MTNHIDHLVLYAELEPIIHYFFSSFINELLSYLDYGLQ